MRKVGIKEIEDIAMGASLLGTGGGGDPYIGKLMAISALQNYGDVTLLDTEEVPDDALVVPIAMMGAPSVLVEKIPNGQEYQILHDMLCQFYGRKISAFMPIESGGFNSMMAFVAAARLGLPLVDADAMGRAFPELQMVTFAMAGISTTPIAMIDEKGNRIIFQTITNKWAEKLARDVTMSCGGAVSVALYCVDGKIAKQFGVRGIISRSQELGHAIRNVKQSKGNAKSNFLSAVDGYMLFCGKIIDVRREVRGAFDFGKVILEGIDEYKGRNAYAEFQNENILAAVDNEIVATIPDLICFVDTENFSPILTDSLKYGKRVMMIGLRCFEAWRTPEGLNLVGPRYFGCDTDYIPIEIRANGGKLNAL